MTTNGAAAAPAPASDNDKPAAPCSAGCLHDLSIYQFDNNGTALQSVYRAKMQFGNAGKYLLRERREKLHA
ncbi:MAG: hypothetical protein IPK98_13360 [Chloracidobacterium sp.]|nr:hypothetical protein [Chloracidobacterium sp.]